MSSATLHRPPRHGVTRVPRPHAPTPAHARGARIDLWTFVLGNAVLWALWGAIAVSATPRYWWPLVPALGWAAVLVGARTYGRSAARPRRAS